jgi:hypothetical protein
MNKIIVGVNTALIFLLRSGVEGRCINTQMNLERAEKTAAYSQAASELSIRPQAVLYARSSKRQAKYQSSKKQDININFTVPEVSRRPVVRKAFPRILKIFFLGIGYGLLLTLAEAILHDKLRVSLSRSVLAVRVTSIVVIAIAVAQNPGMLR